jgi:hypothetical protein
MTLLMMLSVSSPHTGSNFLQRTGLYGSTLVLAARDGQLIFCQQSPTFFPLSPTDPTPIAVEDQDAMKIWSLCAKFHRARRSTRILIEY